MISWVLGLASRDAKVPSQNEAGGFRNLFGTLRFLVDIGRTLDLFCLVVAVLATVSREPGQALTGAAISGEALCEGRLRHAAVFSCVDLTHPRHGCPPIGHGQKIRQNQVEIAG